MKTYTHEELLAMHKGGTRFVDHDGIHCQYTGCDSGVFLFMPLERQGVYLAEWATNDRLQIMGSQTKVLGHLSPIEPNHG